MKNEHNSRRRNERAGPHTLTRRSFLRTTAAAAAGCMSLPGSVYSGNTMQPNFIIFYTDDQGYGDVGCYGADELQTPHMDALAASGVRFTDWYSNSPVCSPSRASLLTGLYPQRAGVPEILGGRGSAGLPPEHPTLADLLKPLGYSTGLVGKWHLGGKDEYLPTARGFDSFFGHLGGCIDYYSHLFIWGVSVPHHDLWRDTTEVWENGEYFTHLITREAKSFLRDNREGPFYLNVAYNAPHYPMHAPKEYFERFAHLPKQRQAQAVMVATIDDSIGAIMEELDALGLRENTVIFFQSDNGPSVELRNFLSQEEGLYLGGSAGGLRGHKASLFEGGIRMPAWLSWPGHIPAGRISTGVGAAMDILPTFLGIAGGTVPGNLNLDGRDILPMAMGEKHSPHDRVFWAYSGQRAVRQGRWKLTLDPKLDFDRKADEEVFLADLGTDPEESVNLAEQQPELVRQLTEAIEAWEADCKS